MKKKLFILSFLFLLLAFNSCYTTKSTTEISRKPIPGTENYQSFSHYDFDYSKSAQKGYYEVRLLRFDNYTTQNEITIDKNKKRNATRHVFCLSPIVLTGPILYFGGVAVDSQEALEGGLAVGALTSAFSYLISLLTMPKYKKTEDIIIKKSPLLKDFTENQKNIVLLLKDKGREISLSPNKKGIFMFNPTINFGLNYFHSDIPINFNVKVDQTILQKKLTIYPSDFLYKYAEISKPISKIYSSTNVSKQIGTTRLGMEYKVIGEKAIYYEIELPSGKTGMINKTDVETFYSDERKADVKQAIQLFVEQEIAKWQKQGEFELPEDYMQRMGKRQEKVDALVNEAVLTYQEDYKNLYDWNKSTISKYNPNTQSFQITVPQLGSFDVHIPVEYAPDFKHRWGRKTISNQKFILVDGNWELASMNINVPNVDYSAAYNSQVAGFYNQSTQFNINFDPVVLHLDKNPDNNQQSDLQDLSYNITANLPPTASNNPDAVAVIIGNAYYQHTTPVKYAINDAQIMKNYLINVLGYKEGTVFFEKNITKGTFENYFGTNDNPNGKLSNIVKEGKSDVFIYYSGHGFPDKDGKAYFLPEDAEPNLVQLGGYSINTFYKNISQLKAKSVTVVLDACFSGYGIDRNVSGVRIVKDVKEDIPNGAILTSSKANEESTWLEQQQHGLFTYFFLRAIHEKEVADKNNDNKLTLEEIYEYVSDNTEGVPYYARRLHQLEQHPECKGNMDRVLVEY